jgi:hypothetical protein
MVVHTFRGIFSTLAVALTGPLADLFYVAAWQTEHSFDRIYVVGEADLMPVCIFNRSIADGQQEKYSKLRIISIPVSIQFFGVFTATEGPNGHGMITSPSLNSPDHRITLQPLDNRFRIDYSGLENLSFSNVGNGNTVPTLCAKPIPTD